MPNQKQLVAGHAKGSWGRSCYSARLPGEYQHFKISSQFVWKRHVQSTELVVNEDETFHEAQKRHKNSKEAKAKVKMLKYCELWHVWHMTVFQERLILIPSFFVDLSIKMSASEARASGQWQQALPPVAASPMWRTAAGRSRHESPVRNWALCVSCICTSFSTSKTQSAASL